MSSMLLGFNFEEAPSASSNLCGSKSLEPLNLGIMGYQRLPLPWKQRSND